MKSGVLLFYSSPNGRDNWKPLRPAEVPAWAKEPDVLGQMVAGEMACKADEPDPIWLRVVEIVTPAAQTELGAVY